MQWTFGTVWQLVTYFGHIVIDEQFPIVATYRLKSALNTTIDTYSVEMGSDLESECEYEILTLSSSSKLNDLMLVLCQ